MAEHLADSFDSDTALLKGRIIKDGTSVIFVSIYLMLLKDGMEASLFSIQIKDIWLLFIVMLLRPIMRHVLLLYL